MPKLSKRALEMAEEFGLSPAQIQISFRSQANTVRQIVEKEFTRIINGDLAEFSGVAGSLKSYKPVSTKFDVTDPATGVTYPTFDITVESTDHKGITGKSGTPLNVFELIDTGRKRLKGLRGKKRYVLWSWNGADGQLSIPVKNKGRGIRNSLTGKFGFTQPQMGPRQTPTRPEPRQQTPDRLPNNEVRGSRWFKGKHRGTRFFAKGPLKAVPPRNLYERIYKNAQKQIKRRKLIYDIVFVKGKR